MKAILLFIIFSSIPAVGFSASCSKMLSKIKVNQKPITRMFKISVTKVKKKNTLALIWRKSNDQINAKKHKDLFLETISSYDDMINAKSSCKKTAERLFFIYPSISYTMPVAELKKVRKFKSNKKAWSSHVLLRTQVAYVKN